MGDAAGCSHAFRTFMLKSKVLIHAINGADSLIVR